MPATSACIAAVPGDRARGHCRGMMSAVDHVAMAEQAQQRSHGRAALVGFCATLRGHTTHRWRAGPCCKKKQSAGADAELRIPAAALWCCVLYQRHGISTGLCCWAHCRHVPASVLRNAARPHHPFWSNLLRAGTPQGARGRHKPQRTHLSCSRMSCPSARVLRELHVFCQTHATCAATYLTACSVCYNRDKASRPAR